MNISNWLNLIFTLINVGFALWNIKLKKELSAPIPFLEPDFEKSGKGSEGLIPLIKVKNIGEGIAENIEVNMELKDIDKNEVQNIKLNGDNTLPSGETGYYEAPKNLFLDKRIIKIKYKNISNKKFNHTWKETEYKYPDPIFSVRNKFKKI